MTDKSIARLEMELEQLKDEKASIKEPASTTIPFFIGLLGVLFIFGLGGLWSFIGFIMAGVGLVGLLAAYGSRATNRARHNEVDEKINEVRELIVKAKENLH